MIQQVVFIILAALTIGSALGVVTARNTVYAALFLVMTFVASAGLWLLLEAEFLALVLVLVYVGAVMVLFLFIIMMLDTDTESLKEGFVRYAPLGILVALIVLAEIGYVVYSREMGVSFGTPLPHPTSFSNTQELGQTIYTAYAFPFEIAAVVLLVGIVAAIMLTLRRRPGVRRQSISRQVRVNAKRGRLRIVNMPAEPRSPEDHK